MPTLLTTKKFLSLRYVLLAAAITTIGTLFPSYVLSEPSGTVVANVNGSPIYQSDLACAVEVDIVREHFSQSPESDISKGLKKTASKAQQTLDRLIDTELLYQESLKHKFQGLTEEVNTRYQSEIKRLGGEKNLRSALSCNNMSPDEFRKAVFRNLSIKRFLNKAIYSKIVITPEEIKEYYDKNPDTFKTRESLRVKQLFLRGPSVDDKQQWRSINEKALDIIRSIKDGGDFVNHVRKYSDEPRSASSGGDMGVIEKGNLHQAFDSVLFGMEEGSVSEPLKSRHGYHIFFVAKRSPATIRPFDEVLGRITTILRKKRAQVMVRELVDDLRSKADIQITGHD
jgi:parvulin-like peptidyl-prolyl isomerase